MSNETNEPLQPPETASSTLIRIQDIVEDAETRCRQDFGDLNELANEIMLAGLLNPITVGPADLLGKHLLKAGARRFRACRDVLHLPYIPAIISGIDTLVVETVENRARKELNLSEKMTNAKEWEKRLARNERARGERVATIPIAAGVTEDVDPPTWQPPEGAPPKLEGERRRDYVARMSGFSSGRVYGQAKELEAAGSPELIAAVNSGERSLKSAVSETKRRTSGQPARKKPVVAEKTAVYYDCVKVALPARLHDIFGDNAWVNMIQFVERVALPAVRSANWNKWLRMGEALDHLDKFLNLIRTTQPYAVHEYCKGQGCDQCRATGWLPMWKWEQMEDERVEWETDGNKIAEPVYAELPDGRPETETVMPPDAADAQLDIGDVTDQDVD